MLKKYTIEDLVVQVNSKIKNEDKFTNIKDNRVSEEVSLRKVRDLLSKGLISRGIKEGRNVYFDEIHVEQILEYKKLQGQGVSERLLRSFSSEYITKIDINENNQVSVENELSGLSDNSFGSSALDEISKITRNLNHNSNRSVVNKTNINDRALNSESLYKTTQSFRDLNKMSVKNFTEYPLEETGGLVLKVEGNYKAKNIEEILEKIKQIIGE